jgi:hypothetical protein
LQFDTGIKRDLWGDPYVGPNVHDTFDSRPATADAKRNDVGVVASVGWSY